MGACSCKLNSTGSVTGSTTGSTTGSSISTQTEKINTKTTDAGSTWFQMIDLADPLDYPKKYISSRSSATQYSQLVDNPFQSEPTSSRIPEVSSTTEGQERSRSISSSGSNDDESYIDKVLNIFKYK